MNAIKLPLKRPKPFPPACRDGVFPWASCLPFLDNKQAQLIHRPRCVTTHSHKKIPYVAVAAWCGNTFCGDTGKLTFISEPAENGKLVCARCEAAAVLAGLPSADEIVGRHVHTGRLKAIRTCCLKEPK